MNNTKIPVLLLACSLVGTGCGETKVEKLSQRDAWIRDAVEELKRFRPTAETRVVAMAPEKYGLIFYVYGEKLLKDIHGNWAYFLSHSSHGDSILIRDENGRLKRLTNIGDISLAIDNRGNIYRSNEHVCGPIFYRRFAGKELKGLPHIDLIFENWELIEGKKDRKFDPTLFAEDLRLIKMVKDLLESRPVNSDSFIALNYQTVEPYGGFVFDFGLASTHYTLRGGYTKTRLRALHTGDLDKPIVAGLKMVQTWDDSRVVSRLKAAWNGTADFDGDKFTCTIVNPELLSKFKARREKQLGAVETKQVPKHLKPHYDLLMDPWARIFFDPGTDLKGRKAITALRQAGAIELIRSVVRSPLPGSRIYGIEALLEMEQEKQVVLSDADKKAIELLLKRDAEIYAKTADGTIRQSNAATILKRFKPSFPSLFP